MQHIRVRFPPSPTGLFHIGNARTALFNYLFAKHHGGVFVLRIEDTDLERSDKKYEKDIFDGLRWLGIDPDEGPEQGGPYGPYRQTERTATYKKYLEKLLRDGTAFYCFHTKEELDGEKKWRMEDKLPLLHYCEWKDISLEEAEKKRADGGASIIRFNVLKYQDPGPSNPQITFSDAVRHQVHFFTLLLGDFSIAKSPEIPLYNFAVVVDDYEMKITDVIRGEDHIANTPKQLLIAWALGWTEKSEDGIGNMQPPWKYAHLPLILGADRSKLSKRHGATSVDEYRQQGYLPEALFNFMALVGWNPGGEREIFSKEELIRHFSLDNVQKSGAIFDFQKLDWMNGEYIRALSLEDLLERAKPFLPKSYNLQPTTYNLRVLALEQPRLKKLSEIEEKTNYFFGQPEYEKELLRWKEMSDQAIAASLQRSEALVSLLGNGVSKSDIEKIFLEAIVDGDKGILLWPLRVALSGKKASPGPFEIMEILGVEESLARIHAAKTKLR